jgi:hypothetical protein
LPSRGRQYQNTIAVRTKTMTPLISKTMGDL